LITNIILALFFWGGGKVKGLEEEFITISDEKAYAIDESLYA